MPDFLVRNRKKQNPNRKNPFAGLTIKDMCEAIAQSKMMTKKNGKHPTAKEIACYSPTGELSSVFWAYVDLLASKGERWELTPDKGWIRK